jgi:hypothetical protein
MTRLEREGHALHMLARLNKRPAEPTDQGLQQGCCEFN